MERYETGAVRDTGGKGRMDLLPMCSLIRVSKHIENTLSHYPERNWEKGLPMHTMLDSAMRHLVKYMDGQTDEDHLCAAATNLLMAMWTEEKRPDMQDIPSRVSRGSSSALEMEDGTPVLPEKEAQEKASERPRRACDAYDSQHRLCCGTPSRKTCYCEGDTWRCDFFPEYRARSTHD